MSRDQEKKRPSLRELLSELGGTLESFAEVIESGGHEIRRRGEIKNFGGIKGANLTYAFSLKTLAGDKITVKEFKNTYGHLYKPPPGETEPLTDVLDGGAHLIIVAELPGVKEDDIKLSVEGGVLTISADTPTMKYRREVLLPSPVKTDLIETSYKSGVLEVKLEKARKVA